MDRFRSAHERAGGSKTIGELKSPGGNTSSSIRRRAGEGNKVGSCSEEQ